LIFCGGQFKYRDGARKISNDCGPEYFSNSVSGSFPTAGTLKTLKKLRAPGEKSGRPPQNPRRIPTLARPAAQARVPDPAQSRVPGFGSGFAVFCGGRFRYRGGARKISNDCGPEYFSNSVSGSFPTAGTLKTLKKLRAPGGKSGRPPQNPRRIPTLARPRLRPGSRIRLKSRSRRGIRCFLWRPLQISRWCTQNFQRLRA
jgi:hypothetical protein